jgi:hypothetical protein
VPGNGSGQPSRPHAVSYGAASTLATMRERRGRPSQCRRLRPTTALRAGPASPDPCVVSRRKAPRRIECVSDFHHRRALDHPQVALPPRQGPGGAGLLARARRVRARLGGW